MTFFDRALPLLAKLFAETNKMHTIRILNVFSFRYGNKEKHVLGEIIYSNNFTNHNLIKFHTAICTIFEQHWVDNFNFKLKLLINIVQYIYIEPWKIRVKFKYIF